ncbi:MAG: precorrin-8X methylmutase [Acidimicrobiales bacterium]
MCSVIHHIEQKSYEILHSRLDLSHLPLLERDVIERTVHATADLEYATTMHCKEEDLTAAVSGLRLGCAVVTDVEMTRSGISTYPAQCYLSRGRSREGRTRTADAMAQAIAEHRSNTIFVIGCAPTALFELIDRYQKGEVDPLLVIGIPVGFVGAAESKVALSESGCPAVYNDGEKGGSAAASAVLNALLRHARSEP